MKKIFPWLLIALVIVSVVISRPMTQTAQARSLRLFIVGNSFSQNATRYLPEIAKSAGHELKIGRAEAPSRTLQMHWEAVEAAEANPDDPKGKIYNGKSLRELLSEGTWDVVTIQQGSFPSGDIETYRPYAQRLQSFIKSLQPQAEILMHQTWAYRVDAKGFAVVGPGRKASTQGEMWEKTRAAYRTIAEELKIGLIPNGDAFWKVDSDPVWGYKVDSNYDFAKPVFPNLPDQTNSLHAGYSWGNDKDGNKTLNLDSNHASAAGCYLGGLMWYGVLFNESPAKITYTPNEVPAAFADHLRKVASETLIVSSLEIAR